MRVLLFGALLLPRRLRYFLLSPVSPLLYRWWPGVATTTAALGRALIHVGLEGFPVRALTTRDINRLAAKS